MSKKHIESPFNIIVIVSALGYFVDIYDLILFNVVKFSSFESLGFDVSLHKQYDTYLFNMQMTGMLIGGLIWGVLGDKKGRKSVLFGSILMYSLANIANAFVWDINSYAIMRFIAGVGLAGELGAGITLVSETMSKENRGYGTMIIVTFGALGAVLASFVGRYLDWKTAYLVGGAMGILLLLIRAGTFESTMFENVSKSKNIVKGSFLMLFKTKERFLKYIACIAVGLPIWFIVGVLINQSYRIHSFENITKVVQVSDAVLYCYIGLSVGDLFSGLLSQWLKSRKKVVITYIVISIVIIGIYLTGTISSYTSFKLLSFLLGAATGYWALFVTIASEQFGTNLRSTVTNSVPNFVRGAVVPINLSFAALAISYSVLTAALIIGSVCLFLALISILYLKETFGKDLDYVELLREN